MWNSCVERGDDHSNNLQQHRSGICRDVGRFLTSTFRTTFVLRFVHVATVRVDGALDHLAIDQSSSARAGGAMVDGPRFIFVVDLLFVMTLFGI